MHPIEHIACCHLFDLYRSTQCPPKVIEVLCALVVVDIADPIGVPERPDTIETPRRADDDDIDR